MSADKSDGKKRRADRVLSDHKIRGKKFVPPLMQFDNLREYSWFRDMLPDFLWLATMLGRRTDWRATRSALDVLDAFVVDGSPGILDGRLTSFDFVPPDRREPAREALMRDAAHALPGRLGHALSLYPDCPAGWLYDDWRKTNEPDQEIGIEVVRSLINEHSDKFGVRETRLRMAAIARLVKHGKFQHSGKGSFAIAGQYPGSLTASEREGVESVMRACWASYYGRQVDKSPGITGWSEQFWNINRTLVPCRNPMPPERDKHIPGAADEDGSLDVEPIQTEDLRDFWIALDVLGEHLRDAQVMAFNDPDKEVRQAVLFGFASRMYRLFFEFARRPSAWGPSTAGLFLRPLFDARILSAWLIHRNDPEIFSSYREHGLGRLKLLREHVKADLQDDESDEVAVFIQHLDDRVNLERDEWAQVVNVGSYADVSIRDMAIEAGLRREYDLGYAPLSSDSHGEWPAIRDHDTVVCEEPIHGRHRIGAFHSPQVLISPLPVSSAFATARDGIVAIYKAAGLTAREAFEPVEVAMNRALFDVRDDPEQ